MILIAPSAKATRIQSIIIINKKNTHTHYRRLKGCTGPNKKFSKHLSVWQGEAKFLSLGIMDGKLIGGLDDSLIGS